MRLIGAKEFLKTVKAGTLYKRFWLNSEKDCLDLIDKYNRNYYLDYSYELEIFGDNSGSLAFLEPTDEREVITIGNKDYTCLFYYDANVVGDAGPNTTLYLVYDGEDEWPSQVEIDNSEDYLTKEELIAIRHWFLKAEGPFRDEAKEGWALETLEKEDYYKNSRIVNYIGD